MASMEDDVMFLRLIVIAVWGWGLVTGIFWWWRGWRW